MKDVKVGVVMGSDSDWPIMRQAVDLLELFGVPHEKSVVSAHRMPDEMFSYAEQAGPRGLSCIIAGAGGAAHLPGMLAAKTIVPVLGVPVPSKHLADQHADWIGCDAGRHEDRRRFCVQPEPHHLLFAFLLLGVTVIVRALL